MGMERPRVDRAAAGLLENGTVIRVYLYRIQQLLISSLLRFLLIVSPSEASL
jgi:hypothetical protein